jgi:hypothetical protein
LFHPDQTPSSADWGKSQPYPNDNSFLDRNAGAGGSVNPPDQSVPPSGSPPSINGGPPTQLPPAQLSTVPTVPAAYPQLPSASPGPPAGGPGQPGSYTGQFGNIPGQSGGNTGQGYMGQPGVNTGQPGANTGQPGANAGQPGANTGQPGGIPPGAVGSAAVGSAAVGSNMHPGDPHVRTMPTAVGGRLELAPWQVPADRVVELSKQLDTQDALNRTLLIRIRELESHGTTREQSLNEAVRDAERADEEAVKARAALQLTREDAAVLRARLQSIEKEDVETLRLVIAALEKLLDVPPARRMP